MELNIKRVRERRKITQAELARMSGISRTTINQLENNRKESTSTKTLLNIARALNTTVDELFLRAAD